MLPFKRTPPTPQCYQHEVLQRACGPQARTKYTEWSPSETAKGSWSSRRTWTRLTEELDEVRPCHHGGHLDQDPDHRQPFLSSRGGPSWPTINVVLDKAEGAAIPPFLFLSGGSDCCASCMESAHGLIDAAWASGLGSSARHVTLLRPALSFLSGRCGFTSQHKDFCHRF